MPDPLPPHPERLERTAILLALSQACRTPLPNILRGRAAGKWGGYPATLGMGLATFDIMAQLLAHPLTDTAQVWTTRWKTSYPGAYSGAWNTDALTARPGLADWPHAAWLVHGMGMKRACSGSVLMQVQNMEPCAGHEAGCACPLHGKAASGG